MCWYISFLLLYVWDWTIIHTSAENCGVERFCGNGAVCENQRCICRKGFRDLQKGTGKVDFCFDICFGKNTSCPTGAKCISFNGNWRCTCIISYRRSDSGVCEDVDECNMARCLNNTVCVNTPGSYRCDCDSGYKREGTSQRTPCYDINECVENSSICGGGANCTNVPGSYRCQCPEAFYLDGDAKPRCLPQTTSVPTSIAYSRNTDAHRYTTTETETKGSNALYIGLGVGIPSLVLVLTLVLAVTYRKRRKTRKKAERASSYFRNESGRLKAEVISDGDIYECIEEPIQYYTNSLEFENEVCKSNISKVSNDSSQQTHTEISGLGVTVARNLSIGRVSAAMEPTDDPEYNTIDESQVVPIGLTIGDQGILGKSSDDPYPNAHKCLNHAPSTDYSGYEIANTVKVLISDVSLDQHGQLYNKGSEKPPLLETTEDDHYNKTYDSQVAPICKAIDDLPTHGTVRDDPYYSSRNNTNCAPPTDDSGYEIASQVKVLISDAIPDQHGQLDNKGSEKPPLPETTEDDPNNKLYDGPVTPIIETNDDLHTQGKARDDPNTRKYMIHVPSTDDSGYEIASKVKVPISNHHGQLNNKAHEKAPLSDSTDDDQVNKLYDIGISPQNSFSESTGI